MALAGVGAGINELTALAATSEMAPTRKRGKYVAICEVLHYRTLFWRFQLTVTIQQ